MTARSLSTRSNHSLSHSRQSTCLRPIACNIRHSLSRIGGGGSRMPEIDRTYLSRYQSSSPSLSAFSVSAFSAFNSSNDVEKTWSERFPILYYSNILQRFCVTLLSIGLLYLVYTTVPLPGLDQTNIPQHFYILPPGTELTLGRRILPAHLFMLGISPFISSGLVISMMAKAAEIGKSSK